MNECPGYIYFCEEKFQETRRVGTCRKNPPTMDQETTDGYFPRVHEDYWCGEFKAEAKTNG